MARAAAHAMSVLSRPRRIERGLFGRACLLLLWAALTAALLWPAVIEAHAGLARSEPAAGAVLAAPPEQVALWFSEPVVAGLTDVAVLDASGAAHGRGPLEFDSNDRNAVRLSLGDLADGVYTVVWRNVSSIDGHAVSGQFSFGVGWDTGALLPAAEERTRSSGLAGTAARWLASAPALAAFGLMLLRVLALPEIDARRLRGWALALLPAALGGGALLLLVQLSTVGGIEGLGATLASRWGVLWSLRVAALGAALALVLARRERAALVAITVALAAASASSHAAASSAALAATLADLAHRLAAGAWLGGLLGLLLSWRTARDRVALVRAFTGLATVAVAGLLAFGLVGALTEVGSWQALRTDYGRVLLVKVGGTSLVLGLAGVNRWWLAPRLAGAGTRWLPRLAAIEVVLLVVLAAFGARLASLEPAWQAAGAAGLMSQARTVEDLRIELRVAPGIVGANNIEVWLRDRRGAAVEGARVVVTLVGPGLAPDEVAAHDLRAGLYHVPGPALNVAGPWSFAIEVQRADAFDARTTFDLEIGATRPQATAPSAARVAVAAALAALVLGAVVAVSVAGGRRPLARGR